jgi:hypothetical protein
MLISRRNFGLGVAAFASLGAGVANAEPDWPNVFISPCGQPFRAKMGAPYPVVDWFKQVDKNGDGKIDHDEFIADFEAFFKTLDVNGDGVLSSYEVAMYEHNIAPEVLGYIVQVGALGGTRLSRPARLWLAQDMPEPQGDTDPMPSESQDDTPQGAAPYGLIQTPEPITGADTSFSGIIRKADFLKLGDRRFTALDDKGLGYLTLAKLPKTYVQKKLGRHGLL